MSKNKTKFEVFISKSVSVQLWGDIPRSEPERKGAGCQRLADCVHYAITNPHFFLPRKLNSLACLLLSQTNSKPSRIIWPKRSRSWLAQACWLRSLIKGECWTWQAAQPGMMQLQSKVETSERQTRSDELTWGSCKPGSWWTEQQGKIICGASSQADIIQNYSESLCSANKISSKKVFFVQNTILALIGLF